MTENTEKNSKVPDTLKIVIFFNEMSFYLTRMQNRKVVFGTSNKFFLRDCTNRGLSYRIQGYRAKFLKM